MRRRRSRRLCANRRSSVPAERTRIAPWRCGRDQETGFSARDDHLAAGFRRHQGGEKAGEIGLIQRPRLLGPMMHQPRQGVGGEDRIEQPVAAQAETRRLGGILGEIDDVLVVQFGQHPDLLLAFDATRAQQVDELRHLVRGFQPQRRQHVIVLAAARLADRDRQTPSEPNADFPGAPDRAQARPHPQRCRSPTLVSRRWKKVLDPARYLPPDWLPATCFNS